MENMKQFLENEKLSEGISKLFEYEDDTPIGSLTDEISAIFNTAEELEKYSETSVKDCIREIYDLTQIDTRETGFEMEDILYLIYKELEYLSDKLGIELEEPEKCLILNKEPKQQNRTPMSKRLTMSKDERLLKILKNLSEYPYTEDKHIKETLSARLMNDFLELADILNENPEKYI